MKAQTKIMYTEERGNNLYLVARGTKMLNAIERHNLKKWGFRSSDRKEYALDLGSSDSLPGLRSCRSMMATLRGFGFVEVDRAMIMNARVYSASITIAVPESKECTQLAGEDTFRYSRMIDANFRHVY